ncbi:MAG: sugar phosphate isomerase/epimerase [Chthoniobacterales bacterium]|nr:sugar phosphate isomerase/epimerase [Chthoniobacterales bacterium]
MLSFSTSWNRRRHTHGEALVEELLEMGINTIELGHGLKVSLLQGIVRMVEQGAIRVSSVHNFCPHPIEMQGDSPDCYEFTSHRETDRIRAVKLTLKTLELAAHVGAKAIVVHGGRVRTLNAYQRALELIQQGKFLTKEFGDMKIEFVKMREAAGPRRLDRLRSALRPILSAAQNLGVLVGLENREKYEDVPSEREMLPFLDSFNSPYLGYWHDFGHAQIKENLCYLDHAEWLKKTANYLIGCHVHDVQWPNHDHLPPGQGEVKFDELIPLLPKDIIIVFELGPDCEREAVLDAWQKWRQIFDS